MEKEKEYTHYTGLSRKDVEEIDEMVRKRLANK